MFRLQALQPQHLEALGVPRRLWLRGGDDAGEGLPYEGAIDVMQSLPSFASPMQKLQLFSDACAEVAECALRHHRRNSPSRCEPSPAAKRPSMRRSRRRSNSPDKSSLRPVPSWLSALDSGAAEAAAGAAADAAVRASRGMPQAPSWQNILDPEQTAAKERRRAERDAELGADELIPLMAYVLVRAKLPNL
eukprot:927683-Prymnesium_polylepis.1